ncbi:MAG TPA: hypothetical protein ENJ82_01410, partial [Bacteroidetes bacterium]|nr:hypothetical protein [Bacteroidota bacterium]
IGDHLGNIAVVVSDRRLPADVNTDGVTDHFASEVRSARDFYPFGMAMPERSFALSGYRYGFQAQEMDDEISSVGNSYSAKFWQYSPRLGKRCNTDPKPSNSITSFGAFANNPIWFGDPFGDTIVINRLGYITRNDGTDYLVFLQKENGNLKALGELGQEIDASEWFSNLLSINAHKSASIISPWTFQNKVRAMGIWDYKNRNRDHPAKLLSRHILGMAFKLKDDKILIDTKFLFEGSKYRAEDLNNLHFGVVGKACGLFGEKFMLRTAGKVEMAKWRNEYAQGRENRLTPEVPQKWRPTIPAQILITQKWGSVATRKEELLPPYGDNPIDHKMIKNGFEYYDKNFKK